MSTGDVGTHTPVIVMERRLAEAEPEPAPSPTAGRSSAPTRRSKLGILLPAILAVLLAACATTAEVTPATPSDPPATPLTSGPPAVADPSGPIPVDLALVDVYLLGDDDILTPVPREVGWDDLVTNSVEALLAGPTVAETQAGLGTALDPAIGINHVTVRGGIAVVDLTANFDAANGTNHMQARLGQVVYTVTEFPEVHGVTFALDGEPVTELPGEGIDLSRPVDRSHYAHLAHLADETPARVPRRQPDPANRGVMARIEPGTRVLATDTRIDNAPRFERPAPANE